MRKYVSQRRNGYGAVDEFDGEGRCLRTIMAGIKPAKDADTIAGQLNEAYWRGRNDAYGDANIAVLSTIAKRPSTIAAETIREHVGAIVAAANETEQA